MKQIHFLPNMDRNGQIKKTKIPLQCCKILFLKNWCKTNYNYLRVRQDLDETKTRLGVTFQDLDETKTWKWSISLGATNARATTTHDKTLKRLCIMCGLSN